MENCYVGMAGPFHSKYRASSCVKVPSSDENDGLLGSLLAITDDLASKYDSTPGIVPGIIRRIVDQRVTHTLTPAEIQTYLSLSIGLEHHSSYCIVVGIVATRLIQNAIDKGERDFRFDVNGLKPPRFFCKYLSPSKNGLPQIVVKGTLGVEAFADTQGNFYLDDLGGNPFEFYPPYDIKSTAVIQKEPVPLFVLGLNEPSDTVSTFYQSRPYDRNLKLITYRQFHSGAGERFIDETIVLKRKQLDAGYENTAVDTYLYPRSCERLFSVTISDSMYSASTNYRMLSDAEFNRRWRPAARAFAKLDELLGSI